MYFSILYNILFKNKRNILFLSDYKPAYTVHIRNFFEFFINIVHAQSIIKKSKPAGINSSGRTFEFRQISRVQLRLIRKE